jgi:hypothetical protein
MTYQDTAGGKKAMTDQTLVRIVLAIRPEKECEKSSRRLCARNIFPVDRVRIARNVRSNSRSEVSKAAGTPDFIVFSRFALRQGLVAPSLQ